MASGYDRRGFTSLFTRWQGGSMIVTDESMGTGRRLFVDSATGTDGTGYGYSVALPVATLDYAVGLCTDDAHDMIILMPGHAETVNAAAHTVLDVRDVRIVGLGHGSDRPTFTFDASVNADIDFDADQVTMENIKFLNTQDACLSPLDINAADCGLKDCLFIDEGADNTIHWLTLDANADNFQLIDAWHEGTDTAGNTGFMTCAACDHLVVKGLVSHGDFAAANIVFTAAATDILIKECRLENLNAIDVCIEGFAGATGHIVRNYMVIPTDAQVTWINTPGSLYLFENYGVNDAGEEGLLAGTPSV